jgi:hypothetical protein
MGLHDKNKSCNNMSVATTITTSTTTQREGKGGWRGWDGEVTLSFVGKAFWTSQVWKGVTHLAGLKGSM